MRRCAWLVCLGVFGVPAGPALAQEVSAEVSAFVEAARTAEIVVLGEIHDNPEHHRNQAEIVRALQPAALVFEMIPQELEDAANALRAEDASREEIGVALDWEARGWPDFDLYAPILEAAPEARIFGAEQQRASIGQALEEGAAAAFGPDATKYGLDRDLDAGEQALREAMMQSAHCDALPEEMLPGMVEVQRLRDASLADAALWARMLTGAEGQVVVITGSGHADRERGMPAKVALADPEVPVIVLGQLEGAPEEADGDSFDMVMLAPAPEREDPCAAFLDREGGG